VELVCVGANTNLLMFICLVPASSGHLGRRLPVDCGAAATCYIGQSATSAHTEEIWHLTSVAFSIQRWKTFIWTVA